jgi:multidrug efflux pump subunit AcrA (membrane-fusion protein)
VLQGDPLWTIADWSRLWLRVPIFEGDLPRLEGEESAEAALPGTHQMASARRVPAPQPTRPGLRTVDLFYELHSGGDTLRPGQPLPVSIPLGTSAERIVIPRSAVLWDGFGNAWVYLRTGEAIFRRQRVELGPPAGEGVVIERGLTPGDQLVTRGAATLHGEEFKGQLQAEDDD